MLRFRRMQSLQKFATVHSSVYNHFNQARHLCSRDNFKLNREAVLVRVHRSESLDPDKQGDGIGNLSHPKIIDDKRNAGQGQD